MGAAGLSGRANDAPSSARLSDERAMAAAWELKRSVVRAFGRQLTLVERA